MNLNNGKAIIEQNGSSLRVTIPSKKNWFILVFGTVWLGGWFFGFQSAIRMMGIIEGESNFGIDWFMTIWLTAWTIGGLLIVGMLLWGYFGKEQIDISFSEFNFSKTVFGLGIKKNLIKNEVKNFRYNVVNESLFGGNRWAIYGLGAGKIKFDYGLKTYSLGLAVDEAEANYLIEMLNKRI